jgi:hypothetical protein
MIHAIKLSTWWLPQTSGTHILESRRFESMYTLQGKTQPTRHMLPMLSPRIALDHTYLTWSTYSNLSRVVDSSESLLLRKRAPDTIHNMPTDRSVGPYLVSLQSQPMKQWRKPNIYRQQATRLTGPISVACNWYVQYLLAGANPSFLNRHRRGLQPWSCQLSTYHFLTFPTSCLPFPPKVPA